MNRTSAPAGALILALILAGAAEAPAPPRAAKHPRTTTEHGDTRVDEYAWLRDRENPEVIEYLEKENAYAKEVMAPTEDLQDRLYREMLGRIKETDLSVPYKDGRYYYFTRTEEGKAYPLYYRTPSLNAEQQLMLDVNLLAEGHEYTKVTAWEVSPDGTLLAYAVDHSGYERPTLRIRNLETGEDLADVIEEVGSWSLAWGNDDILFYTRLDETNRPDRLYRHRMGTPPEDDELVFHEKDEKFWLQVSRSRSESFLFLALGSNVTSEVWYLRTTDPTGDFTLIAPRRQGIEYEVDHRGDKFYILTNDQAENFRVVEASPIFPGPENWKDFIPHDPDVYIEAHLALSDYLVLAERRNGCRTIRVHRFGSGQEYVVEQPEEVSVATPRNNYDFRSTVLRYAYSSLVTPETIYDFDLETRERRQLKQETVVGGYDPSLYRTVREWATAEDGVRIPISVVSRKDVPTDGSNPCLLYGYGSYGISIEPTFDSKRLSLLDRGFVFAIAHVRGGGEMGRRWYEEGKFLNKRNTFTDFIACAERMIELGYTSPAHLGIRGGSAGGLLVGAVLNLRPDLFHAAHAAVPFVDVVNTMLDASIPLTVIEYDEWGNPNRREYYDYMKSYSPYENVTAQDYPDLLITAGLNDPRVQYWEPAKWAAKLRATKTDDNLLLLKTNMGAGHGGASGRYSRLKEIAFEYAFLIDRLGASREPRGGSSPE